MIRKPDVPEDGSVKSPPGDDTDTPEKLFRVWVVDNRSVLYVVEADDEDQARQLVEESEDADEEFGGTTKDSSWYVDNVEPA